MFALAKACSASGFYKDAKDPNKAIVKMMIGHELGIGPGASLSGIYIVQDKVVLSSNLLAGLVKKSGRYDYRVKLLDAEKGCVLEFFEVQETPQGKKLTSIGTSEFLKADAERAGLLNKPGPWKQYPKNMYFARALSNGQRMFAPDLSAGTPVYTPNELGVEENEDGEIVADDGSPTSPTIAKKLQDLCNQTETSVEALLRHYGSPTIADLGDQAASAAISLLEQKLAIRQVQQVQLNKNNAAATVAVANVQEPESVESVESVEVKKESD